MFQSLTDIVNGAGGLAFTISSGNVLDYVDENCRKMGIYLLYRSNATDMPQTGPYFYLVLVYSDEQAIVLGTRIGSGQYNYQNNKQSGTWQGWYRYTGTSVS